MKSVFDFKDYKAFLNAVEASRKTLERGFRTKLAQFIGCQSGYISHVLNGVANFSLEQALRVSKFLAMNEREERFFVLLIEHERAGTKELSRFFEKQLSALRDEHLNIKQRVGDSRTLSELEQSTYYSSWHYLAIHVLTSLPDYNDAKSVAHALRIPDEVARNVLIFLIKVGIVIEEEGGLMPGLTQVHLNRESPLIRQHHTNSRISAIQSLMNDTKNDLHYSTLSSLSRADADKLRSEMVNLIERYVETVKPSPEEVVYGFNLDFYGLIKG